MLFQDCEQLTSLSQQAGMKERDFITKLNNILVRRNIIYDVEDDDFIGMTIEYCIRESVGFTYTTLAEILDELGIDNGHKNCVLLGSIRLKGYGDCPVCGAKIDETDTIDSDVTREKETGAYVGWVESICPKCGKIIRTEL